MSVVTNLESEEDVDDIELDLNWEFIIHKTLSWSLWLFAGSFGLLFLIYYIGADKAVVSAGALLGLYLLALCGESVLGAAFNDDNNPANMSKLGKLLSRFQVHKPATN